MICPKCQGAVSPDGRCSKCVDIDKVTTAVLELQTMTSLMKRYGHKFINCALSVRHALTMVESIEFSLGLPEVHDTCRDMASQFCLALRVSLSKISPLEQELIKSHGDKMMPIVTQVHVICVLLGYLAMATEQEGFPPQLTSSVATVITELMNRLVKLDPRFPEAMNGKFNATYELNDEEAGRVSSLMRVMEPS